MSHITYMRWNVKKRESSRFFYGIAKVYSLGLQFNQSAFIRTFNDALERTFFDN